MVYVKGEKYKKLYSVSTQTLRSWADTGKVESVRTPGGVRLYKLPEDQHLQLQNQAAQLSIHFADLDTDCNYYYYYYLIYSGF